MGSEIFAMTRERAVEWLVRAPRLQLASTACDGSPFGGGVGFVVGDGALWLDAPGLACAGRPGVLTAERVIATLPDAPGVWMERIRVRGVLTADGPQLRMSLAGLEGEVRVGQELSPEARRATLERLWARGLPGDPAAIERARAASPGTPVPAFLAGPPGVTMSCALEPHDVDDAVGMLAGEYWNLDLTRETVGDALLGSAAWVGARDAEGRLLAGARAIGDGAKVAWLYDVIVRPDWRGRGLGHAVVKLLLDHPLVRRARAVRLDTRDAQGLYERFGFVDRVRVPRPFPSTHMVLRRR